MSKALQELLQRHIFAENQRDLAATLETLHRDCVLEDQATGQRWCGHAGAADHYTQWWAKFDVAVGQEPGQVGHWATPSLFIAEVTWSGTHVGDFLGVKATGRKFVQPFVVFATIMNGLVAGERLYYDLASLLAQLGADCLPDLSTLPHRVSAR